MNPIIKWAGGKRQLIPELRQRFPDTYGRYYEPFLGSGALFLDICPRRASLNDFNPELINMYIQIRDNVERLSAELVYIEQTYNAFQEVEERAQYYYVLRREFNENIHNPNALGLRDAALFIFLNKACYNGLYRVNNQGMFNTPFGKRKRLSMFDGDNIQECSEALRSVTIRNVDFELACRPARRGDLVYFDSPYYDTFDSYQAGGFPVSEHLRLNNLFVRLTNRGVFCILSNSNTQFIRDLYKDFHISVVPVKRMINRDGTGRQDTEVIITNY